MVAEKDVEEYDLVKRWFAKYEELRKKPYAKSTKKEYVGYMKMWCQFTGKTPDELAISDIDKMRGIITEGWKKMGLSINSITHRTNALNSFWKYNGRQIKRGHEYDGISDDVRRDIKRERGGKLKRD